MDHFSSDKVVDYDVFARLYFESYDILLSLCDEGIYFLFVHCQRVSHLHASGGVVLEVGDFVSLGFQFGGSIECDVGFSRSSSWFTYLR